MTLRWAAGLVSAKVLHSVRMQHLRSGHSHEDVDQLFGSVSRYLLKAKKLLTADDVVQWVRKFLAQAKLREKDRHCIKLDQVRDWTL